MVSIVIILVVLNWSPLSMRRQSNIFRRKNNRVRKDGLILVERSLIVKTQMFRPVLKRSSVPGVFLSTLQFTPNSLAFGGRSCQPFI